MLQNVGGEHARGEAPEDNSTIRHVVYLIRARDRALDDERPETELREPPFQMSGEVREPRVRIEVKSRRYLASLGHGDNPGQGMKAGVSEQRRERVYASGVLAEQFLRWVRVAGHCFIPPKTKKSAGCTRGFTLHPSEKPRLRFVDKHG